MSDKYTLDRATYKQIKAMDKDKMSEFLSNVYLTGKADCESENVDLSELKAEIGKIKGIGETRLNEIMDAIERFISSKTE